MSQTTASFILFLAFGTHIFSIILANIGIPGISTFHWEYIITLPLVFGLLPQIYRKENLKLRHKFEFLLVLVLLPHLCGIVYTVFLACLQQHTRVSLNLFMFNFRQLLLIGYRIFLGALLVLRFREKTLDIFCNAYIPSYIFNIANALIHIGPSGIIRYLVTTTYLTDTGFNQYFELHDYGLSVGILIMYQLFFREEGTNWPVTIALAAIKIFCWKRIALFALALCVMVYPFVKTKHIFQRNRKVYLLMAAVLATCFMYVMLTAGSETVALMQRYGVDFSGRFGIAVSVRRFYEWSLSFCGNGLNFVNNYVAFESSSRIGALHNDILTVYVDLGFVGFIAWFAFSLFGVTRLLDKHYGHSVSFMYSILITYAHVVYMTDNVARYFLFQFLTYSLIMVGIVNACDKRKTARAA